MINQKTLFKVPWGNFIIIIHPFAPTSPTAIDCSLRIGKLVTWLNALFFVPCPILAVIDEKVHMMESRMRETLKRVGLNW